MAKEEEIPQTNAAEVEDLIKQIRGTNLEPGVKAKIERLLVTILNLVALLQRKNISIAKLRKLIFGHRRHPGFADPDLPVEWGQRAGLFGDDHPKSRECTAQSPSLSALELQVESPGRRRGGSAGGLKIGRGKFAPGRSELRLLRQAVVKYNGKLLRRERMRGCVLSVGPPA
jgi:hypothetical protein